MPDKASGKAKEAFGALTGDDSKKREGQAEQDVAKASDEAKAKAKEAEARRKRGSDNPIGKLLGG